MQAYKYPEKSTAGKGNSKCKGPGAGVCVLRLRDIQKARGVTIARVIGKVIGGSGADHVGLCRVRTLHFTVKEMGSH